MPILEISGAKAIEVIEQREELGLYIVQEGEKWVGIDNSTGDAWTEDFDTREECIDWLAD